MAAPAVNTDPLETLKAENLRLTEELRRVSEQRDVLASISQAQGALLTEIVRDNLIIPMRTWQTAAPALNQCPGAAQQAFIHLLVDAGQDGVTKQHWTGLTLGKAIGLTRASRERLIGPLEAAGIIAPEQPGARKATSYRIKVLENNALSQRISALQTRCYSVLFGADTPAVWFPAAADNALPQHIKPQNTLPQRVLPPNTLLQRIKPFDDDESITDILIGEESSSKSVWTSADLEIIGAAINGWGVSKALRAKLYTQKPEVALAFALQAQKGRQKAGLLRVLLQDGSAPAAEYLQQARQKLARVLPTPPLPIVSEDSRRPAYIQPENLEPADDPSVDQPLGNEYTPHTAWLAVLNQLRFHVNQTDFDLWLQQSKAKSCTDGVITVWVRHAYGPSWLKSHLSHLAERFLAKITGTTLRVRWISELQDSDRPETFDTLSLLAGWDTVTPPAYEHSNPAMRGTP